MTGRPPYASFSLKQGNRSDIYFKEPINILFSNRSDLKLANLPKYKEKDVSWASKIDLISYLLI